MVTSQNGWVAGSKAVCNIKPLMVGKINAAAPGVAHHDHAAMVLAYVAWQFHHRVERLHQGWNWGWFYRAVRGALDLSNHASGTAIDLNAPYHPLGTDPGAHFSQKQIDTIHDILAELDNVVRWGGDYQGRKDPMHFELNASVASVNAVGQRIYDNGGIKVKLLDRIKPKPKPKPKDVVRGAPGSGVINVLAVVPDNQAPGDIRQLQHVLNLWYPHDAIDEDGVYGPATDALFDYAREALGLGGTVADVDVRRRTLRKLGFKTTN